MLAMLSNAARSSYLDEHVGNKHRIHYCLLKLGSISATNFSCADKAQFI